MTKEQAKQMQLDAQKSGVAPKFDYNQYDSQALMKRVSKDASIMVLQSIAITTGMFLVQKRWKGETIEGDEVLETVIRTGADTGLKTVLAATVKIAVEKGILKAIPKTTPAAVFTNVACVAVENVKILYKVATGKISPTKGVEEMGKTSISMAGGMLAMGKMAKVVKASTIISSMAPITIVVGGFVAGTVAYTAGSKVGDMVFEGFKKVATVAKTVGKIAVDGLKPTEKVAGKLVKSSRNTEAQGLG